MPSGSSLEIGILGFPKAGKTTVFNALTQGRAETAPYLARSLKPNIGVAQVPDPRLQLLAELFRPERLVHAEVRYIDIPGQPEGFGTGIGVAGELLNILQDVDAILHVVRAFEEPAIPTVVGAASPEAAIKSMDLELAFADLSILENRLHRLETMEKGAKAQERAALHVEQELLGRLKAGLEGDIPAREQEVSPQEQKTLENYHLLTAKPLLTVLNLGEEQGLEFLTLERQLQERFHRSKIGFVAMCGKLEMELSQLSGEEEVEFRRSLGAGEPSRERVLRASYELLGLISFFTVVSGEVKAWSVARSTSALQAAGKIHSDMERGFIRAEVVAFDDLAQCRSMAEVRRRGHLRLEGKGYPVQDGDVITFLFNV